MDLEQKINKIDSLLHEKDYRPMTQTDMMYLMEVPPTAKHEFETALETLVSRGKAVITKKGKIMAPEKLNMRTGIFSMTARGFGFVKTDDPLEDDIFIPADYVNDAMNKDRVLCRVLEGAHGEYRREGEIIKVLVRGNDRIVGLYTEFNGRAFVVPDDKRINHDIYIAKGNRAGAVSGHKVMVKLIKPPQEDLNPEGKITEILGHVNDPGVDILSIIMQYGLPTEFSEEVYSETEKIPENVMPEDLDGRRDLRSELTVTIDGEDAKDLDDAVTISRIENGYKLGVHIADVTHYVRENTNLDKSAFKRGTSVYLTDRVIPMLPHKLSNGICSLNEGTDRLALSCEMEIDTSGHVTRHEIFTSVINVNKRMTYELVNSILKGGEPDFETEHPDLCGMFKDMEELAGILREKRIKRGAIEFDFAEAKILLNEEGIPIDIVPRERNTATGIIEEFMLVCNETVAEQHFWMDIPFVYRTHEEPDPEKIEFLSGFLKMFGYSLKKSHPKSIQKLLSKIESTPEESIISRLILRSFKQARYTSENLGHYGLAAKYYCHFTSPIRRYPDLQIHRIIKQALSGQQVSVKNLPEIASHCSITERVAEEVEREVENLKKVQYMADKQGEVFSGIVSSVVSWGAYVELPNTVEGLIHVSSLKDDYYIFDKDTLSLTSENTGKTFRPGDAVIVKVSRASIEERKLYFVPADCAE